MAKIAMRAMRAMRAKRSFRKVEAKRARRERKMKNLLDWSTQRGAPRGQENWSELQPENKVHFVIICDGDDVDVKRG